ncbi:MAG: hypothetical protein ACI4TD_14630 [Phocaeicola sp.]
MTNVEVKQQAIEILQDIIQFYQPLYAEGILTEFEQRLNSI